MLQVRVPVLSLKIYSICPNSSLRFEELTIAGIAVLFWVRFGSLEIAMPWASLTDSKVTNKEIGTKFLLRKLYNK